MPRLPLARTYRPQRFAEVLGQQVPVRALGAAAARGDVASAYLFSGTRGIGKTTIARIFAKTLNCAKGPAEDCCDECVACREIAEGRALDVLELDAATHTGIDDIRELREAAQYPPGRDRFRVFILDEAHQLSQSAWNGLLKVLEEPPPWCVFLFCTTEPHKIPATIESRALHFSFRSPTPAQLTDHLAAIAAKEGIPLEPGALELLVRAADGSVRDGLSALDQVRALEAGTITRETVRAALGLIPGEAVARYVEALIDGDAAAALAVIGELDDEGQDLRAFAAEALDRVRRTALVKTVGPSAAPAGSEVAAAADRASAEQLVWLGRVLDEIESRLRQGGAQRTLLDLATVRMGRMASLTSLAELVDQLGARGTPAPPRGPGSPQSVPPPAASGGRPGRPPGTGSRGAAPAGPAVDAAPATDAGPTPPAPEGLVAMLVEAARQIRPGVAACLRNVRSAEVLRSGALRLVLPTGKAIFEGQLTRAQDVLAQAAQDATGERPTQIEIIVEGAEEARPNGNGPVGRREAFERARRNPLVRALFDQLGAVVLDGQVLAPGRPDKPQE